MKKSFLISGMMAFMILMMSTHSFGQIQWVSIGPDGGTVRALAINVQAPDTLYVGTESGVLKSTNGGMNWTAMNSGLNNAGVWVFAIDPQAPDTLYAGTLGNGVFKSTNGGNSWTVTDLQGYIWALAIDPQTPDTLYAGNDQGLYKSTNGGVNWIPINGLPTAEVYAIAINPHAPTTLYVGSHGGGVFKSINGGTTWTPINIGLTTNLIYALAIDPQVPDTLYVGTHEGGVFKSTNGGGNWAPMNSGLPLIPYANVLAIDPNTPNTLYAGTYNDGVFKSTNGGANWTQINSGLTNTDIFAIAIDPKGPTILYAGTGGGGVFKLENRSFPLYRKIRFVTETGDTITTADKTMSHYFVSGEDRRMTMVLREPLNFLSTNPDIGIVRGSGVNCMASGDGGVVVTAGKTFSFAVKSATAGAILSAHQLPINASGAEATFDPGSGVFHWSTSLSDIGTYLVEFQATITDPAPLNSRSIVAIKVNP